MRRSNTIFTIIVMLLFSMASVTAIARGSRGHSAGHSGGYSSAHRGTASHLHTRGIVTTPALRYYPPARYYPAVVMAQAAPVIYIEQADVSASSLPPGYWYYCVATQAYYPSVDECAGGWYPVAPQPPSGY